LQLVPDRSDRVMPALVAVCPSFDQQWAALLSDAEGENGPYVAVGQFAAHLVDKLQNDETSEFPEVFRVVEDLLAADEPGVRDLVVVGLIEDLQNDAGQAPAGAFRPWLGALTATAWDDVNRFWQEVSG
jgi:hypothetical protein